MTKQPYERTIETGIAWYLGVCFVGPLQKHGKFIPLTSRAWRKLLASLHPGHPT